MDIEGLSEVELIGSGGFADVFKAREDAHARTVAVKVIRTVADSEAMLRLFRRERVAMGRLGEHEGIVSVHRSGVTDEGQPYLVMPLLDCSLADMLERDPLDQGEAIRVMALVSAGIQFAHDNGVVHRDLKPANILMSWRGNPVVADFGVAKLVDKGRTLNSMSVRMTPEYSSPGVIMGRPVGAADDVYSLGATLFTCLVARPPFAPTSDEEANVYATMRRIVEEPIEDLRPSGVDDRLCSIIERAMDKEPAERFSTAAEFGAALGAPDDSEDNAGAASSVRRRVSSTSPTRQFVDPTPTADAQAATVGASRRVLVFAAMFVAVVLIGISAWAVSRSPGESGEVVSDLQYDLPATSDEPATSSTTEPETTSVPPTPSTTDTATTSIPSSAVTTTSAATTTTARVATATTAGTATATTAAFPDVPDTFPTTTTTTIQLFVVPSVAGSTGEQAVIRLGQSRLEASCGLRCTDAVVGTSPPVGTELPADSLVELRF